MTTALDPCDLLEWDTTFWGFKTARVRAAVLTPESVPQIDGWSRRSGVRCLYFLARSDDVRTTRLAEGSGFQLVDIRMTLRRAVAGDAPVAVSEAGTCVRNWDPDDLDQLRQIARASYRDSRFYFDPHFPRERCDALYEAWVTRSCEGYADAVLVADLDGKVSGYISCHVDLAVGSIGLIGVGSEARGQGVGNRLVMSAVKWFAARDVRKVTVVTQGRNVAAQRLYQRCGFLTDAVQLWYHRWYPDTEAPHR